MATFNGAPYIHVQLESILAQLKANDEVIISDDGSTDGTVDIIDDFGDGRIKVVFNQLDKGYSGNFENAIAHASGDIIFLSDQDDVWLMGKIESMCAALENCDMVVSDARYVGAQLQGDDGTFFERRGGKTGFLANLYKSRYLGACMAFKSTLLPKLLPFPVKRQLCPHDLWITLIGELYFKVATVNVPFILYRRHGSNASSGGVSRRGNFIHRISFRLYSLLMVLSRVRK